MRRSLEVFAVGLVLLAVLVPPGGAAPAEDKSLGKALLLSLAVPGAGEAYLGAPGRARAFMASEAAIWASFAFFRVQGRMREDAYIEEARLFAGIEGDRSDDYYKILSYYLSSEEYNIDVMREARLRYPLDRAEQLAFFEANSYVGDDAWQWESAERMREFADERTMSRESYRRAVLTTGFAVLNRIVSMIDVYLSFRLDESRGTRPRLGLAAEPTSTRGFRLYLSAPF